MPQFIYRTRGTGKGMSLLPPQFLREVHHVHQTFLTRLSVVDVVAALPLAGVVVAVEAISKGSLELTIATAAFPLAGGSAEVPEDLRGGVGTVGASGGAKGAVVEVVEER